MEKKKRDEAAFKEQKNRELKRVQGNDQLDERKDDDDIQNEIKRLNKALEEAKDRTREVGGLGRLLCKMKKKRLISTRF